MRRKADSYQNSVFLSGSNQSWFSLKDYCISEIVHENFPYQQSDPTFYSDAQDDASRAFHGEVDHCTTSRNDGV